VLFVQVVAAVCAFALLAQRTDDPEERAESPVPFSLAAALGAVASLAGTWPWLRGVPAFAHDWKWPLTPLQSHDQLAPLSSIWLPWGSGAPAVQALGNYPIALCGWLLGYALSQPLALVILLALLGAAAAVSIRLLAARTGLGAPYQIALCLSVCALPAWFNRLCAGHLEWLLGCALFPAALALALTPVRRARTAGSLGALWGLAGGQAQFLLFFPLAALPGALRARRAGVALVGLVLALGLQTPAIVSAFYAHSVNAFAGDRVNLTWQLAQSDPLRLALISGADPAHYFALWESPLTVVFSLLLIVLAAFGSLQTGLTRMLAALWIAAAIWSSGLNGPLAIPIAWLFTHFPDMIVLREFAHTQAIVAPIFALLVAHGIAGLRARPSIVPALRGAAVFAVLLPLTAAVFFGGAPSIARPIAPSPERDALARAIDELPGSGQILWWPGLEPVAVNHSRGGVDGDAFVIGAHAPYTEYRPTPALAQAVTALDRGDRATCGLLGDLGIAAVVIRHDATIPAGNAFSSLHVPRAAQLEGAGLPLLATYGSSELYGVPCFRGRFTLAPATTIAGDWTSIVNIARVAGATDEHTVPPPAPKGCESIRFAPSSFRSVDPARDWVPLSELDRDFLAFDNAFGNVFVTSDASRAPQTWVLAAKKDAAYAWISAQTARAWIPQTVAVWRAANCPQATRSISLRDGARAMPSRPAPAEAATLSLATIAVAHYAPLGGWKLLANGETASRPVAADGFAAGWLLAPGHWQLAFVPSGPAIGWLWSLAIVAGALCITLIVIGNRDP
jgi:hypothetical protein